MRIGSRAATTILASIDVHNAAKSQAIEVFCDTAHAINALGYSLPSQSSGGNPHDMLF